LFLRYFLLGFQPETTKVIHVPITSSLNMQPQHESRHGDRFNLYES
jgi:hypothetical protein